MEALTTALRDRLQLDPDIAAALAATPASGPAIYMKQRKPDGALYDCLVLDNQSDSPQGLYTDPGTYMFDLIYGIEAWTQSRTSGRTQDIQDLLILPLLENQSFGLPDTTLGSRIIRATCYHCRRLPGGAADLEDRRVKAWGSFHRYLFQVRAWQAS